MNYKWDEPKVGSIRPDALLLCRWQPPRSDLSFISMDSAAVEDTDQLSFQSVNKKWCQMWQPFDLLVPTMTNSAWHDLIHDFLPQTYVEPVDTLPFPSVHSWPDVDTSCLSIKGVSLRKQWAQQRHYDCSVRIAVTVQADAWLSVFEHKTHCISLSIKGLISGQRRNRTWSWRLSKSQAWVFDLTIIKSKYKGELCLTRLFYIFGRLP